MSYQIENLEVRRLLTGDPYFSLTSKGTLIVQGTAANENITVDLVHGQPSGGISVDVGATYPDLKYAIDHQIHLNFKVVKRFYIDGGDGDDTITINDTKITQSASLLGGAGDDHISWNSSGMVVADGGDGNDTISDTSLFVIPAKKNRDTLNDLFANHPIGSANTLLGGDGDDVLEADITDHVDGGNGNDTAQLIVSSPQPVSVNQANGLASDFYTRLGTIDVESFVGMQL